MRPSLVSLAAVVASVVAPAFGAALSKRQGSLPVITAEGNAFWNGDERFYMRGVAYQPGGASNAKDPLLDIPTLTSDIEQFKKLGINTIRIYTIDNSQNHDEGMKLLDDAGIYLALDANTPKFSLNRENIGSLHASYNDIYLQSVFATIEAFKNYNNLLVLFSGNEVINSDNNTNAAPYIKAVTRDMRRYIAKQADRAIPVGYSAADVAENIEPQALYFACGEDENARADFFAFNDYSWCDPSSFQQAGWDKKVETYKDYSLPIFLSEFGCITNTREWGEIASLYSSDMTAVYSGGLAYEFTLEANGYGLVEMGSDGQAEPNADFDRLQQAYEKTPLPTGDNGARKSTTPPECPPQSKNWQVDTLNLPAIPEGAEKYIEEGAGTGPGLDTTGDGSQWAGTPSATAPDLADGVTTSEGSTGVNATGTTGGSRTASSNTPTSAANSLQMTFGSVAIAVVAAAAASW